MLLSNLELSARQFLTQEGEDELELESKAGRTASSPQTQAFNSKEVFGVMPSGLEGCVQSYSGCRTCISSESELLHASLTGRSVNRATPDYDGGYWTKIQHEKLVGNGPV